MNNNFRRVNIWVKVSIITFVIFIALEQLYSKTNLVDWWSYIDDDVVWIFVIYAFNMIVETFIGCIRWIADKFKNLKRKES